MINYKTFSILLLLIGLCNISIAQDRYAVKYKYKPQETYSLEQPGEFLTQKAIDRRIREKIAFDSTDLPVSEKYIRQIQEQVDQIQYHSKWFNSSIVVATSDQVAALEALDFVDNVELVARGFYDDSHSARKESFLSPWRLRLKKRERAYEFQNELLGIPDMHQEGFTGKGITIAVFDGGFLNVEKIPALRHLLENDRILATRDFVLPGSDNVFRTDTHGTGSLSLMAANDEGSLISGAYNSNFILCITEDVRSEFRVEEYNWVRAAEFSDSLGVDIINSSLGYNVFNDPEMNYSKGDLDGKTALITRGATRAAEKGILVVTSAGNEGGGNWKTVTAPADAEGILSIGSVTNNLNKSSFSSTGPTADGRIKPELTTLGSSVSLWRSTTGVGTASGTSFSAPQVAALAAGLWEAMPHLTKKQLAELMISTASLANDPDNDFGYGIPNFSRAFYGAVKEVAEKEEEKIVQ